MGFRPWGVVIEELEVCISTEGSASGLVFPSMLIGRIQKQNHMEASY